MGGEVIIEHAAITAAIHLLERVRRVRFLRCRLVHPNAEIRVSFSALLRISDGGRYVLVRNLHRPEVFGPFGGVYKYHDVCRPLFDRWLFRAQDIGPTRDMRNDLRGFLPRKNLAKLMKWYSGHSDRESPTECLLRELKEETTEIDLGSAVTAPTHIDVRKVRTVEEGPEKVPGQTYTQYRVFDIYDPIARDRYGMAFFEQLVSLATGHGDLLLATTQEVIAGRSGDGKVIGAHATYLVSDKRVRPDAPPFVDVRR